MSNRFVKACIAEFIRYHSLADKTFAQIKDEDWFKRENEAENSIALIVKHVAGNLQSRWTNFLTEDGEKPWRERDQEFELFDGDTVVSLRRNWDSAWQVLFDGLNGLKEKDLDQMVTIRGEPISVPEAIIRSLAHSSYHVGQIVDITKRYKGEDFASLSTPKRSSQKYLDEMKAFHEKSLKA